MVSTSNSCHWHRVSTKAINIIGDQKKEKHRSFHIETCTAMLSQKGKVGFPLHHCRLHNDDMGQIGFYFR